MIKEHFSLLLKKRKVEMLWKSWCTHIKKFWESEI